MRPVWKGFALTMALVMLLSGCTSTSINHPPSITGWEPRTEPSIPEEGNLTFEVSASDQDGQKLGCRWYLDGALAASTAGKQPFAYSYSPGNAAGNHTLSAVVSDGSLLALHNWHIFVYNINHRPAISGAVPSGREPPVNEGEALNFSAVASDPDGDALVLVWTFDGQQVAQDQERYCLRPGFEMAGAHQLRLNVSDGQLYAEMVWNVTVVNVDRAPRLVSAFPTADPRLTETQSQEFSAEAVDDDGDAVSYSWTLDGVIVGSGNRYDYTPGYLSQGDHEVTVTAGDGTLEVRRGWHVLVADLNRPPALASFSPEGDAATSEWSSVDFSLVGTDEDGDALTVSWYVDGSAVPSGTGGVFSYIPGYDSVGNHTVRGVLSDGNASVSRSWNVSVRRAVANWTVLAYMNADNDLEPYLLEDLGEMEEAGSTPLVNIVVQLDRHPSYDASNGDWTETRRYRVERDGRPSIGSRLLMSLGELDMGSQQALNDFLLWGLEKFPAERYQVVMSGHGDGWMGISQDFSNASHRLSPAQAASALGAFKAARGAPIEVLEFDVCYWAMLETGWAVRDLASYMVASEEIDPSPGNRYDLYLADLIARPEMDARELASAALRSFYRAYAEGNYWPEDNETFTHSTIELSRVGGAASSLDGLAGLLEGNMTALRPALAAARLSVQEFGKPEFIDLYDLVRLLRQGSSSDALNASADAVLAALGELVVAEVHGTERARAHGLSIYFPSQRSAYRASYADLDFAKEHLWGGMLLAYYNASGRGAGGRSMAPFTGPFPQRLEGLTFADAADMNPSPMAPDRPWARPAMKSSGASGDGCTVQERS